MFLAETGLELDDIYANKSSWTDLRRAAGLSVAAAGPCEVSLLRGCGRMLHVLDPHRIAAYKRLLEQPAADPATLPLNERRFLQMLVASVADRAVAKTTTLAQGAAIVHAHRNVCDELLALLEELQSRITHSTLPLASHSDVPLEVHARYSRLEILAAFGVRDTAEGAVAKMPPWQTGVYWAKAAKADLLAFTLDKTSGGFSPTTRYRDYAISRELIHWESQTATRAESAVGKRYQQHGQQGSSIMLFARVNASDRAFWFLGPATFVNHEGEMPMAITWRLTYPLPAELFTAFAAAVA